MYLIREGEDMDTSISTKKAIGGSFTAIIILVISQTLAQLIASMFLLLRIQDGICNIIAGILYVSIAYVFLLLFTNKLIKRGLRDFFEAENKKIKTDSSVDFENISLKAEETPKPPIVLSKSAQQESSRSRKTFRSLVNGL